LRFERRRNEKGKETTCSLSLQTRVVPLHRPLVLGNVLHNHLAGTTSIGAGRPALLSLLGGLGEGHQLLVHVRRGSWPVHGPLQGPGREEDLLAVTGQRDAEVVQVAQVQLLDQLQLAKRVVQKVVRVPLEPELGKPLHHLALGLPHHRPLHRQRVALAIPVRLETLSRQAVTLHVLPRPLAAAAAAQLGLVLGIETHQGAGGQLLAQGLEGIQALEYFADDAVVLVPLHPDVVELTLVALSLRIRVGQPPR